MLVRCFRHAPLAVILLSLLLSGCAATLGAKPTTPTLRAAEAAIVQAMAELDAQPGDAGLLLITNAGYGSMLGEGSEASLDIAMRATGCTPGTRSLLTIVTSAREPLWFALANSPDHKIVFLKINGGGYFDRQILDIAPDHILTPDGWAEAARGPVGKRLFSVASIALSKGAGASWPMLKAAELHDHFCPGLNVGFIVLEYLNRALPLDEGDSYTFIGAPPFCAMDAFQILEGKSLGKRGSLGLSGTPAAAAALTKNGISPRLVVLRVNKKKDTCDGVVLGLDWAGIYATAGLGKDDLNPPGGHANPMFYVSRATMSYSMAKTPMEDKLGCVVELRRFSGPAKLAAGITSAGADPYAVIQRGD